MSRRLLVDLAVAAILLALVAGCGGGGGGGTPPSGDATIPAEHVAVGDQCSAVFEDALAAGTPESAAAAVESFARTQASVDETGISDGGITAWVHFRGGGTWFWTTRAPANGAVPAARPQSILTRAVPLAASSTRGTASSRSFPSGNKAVVIDCLDDPFGRISDIAALLESCGYSVDLKPPAMATPALFKHLSSYDFVYMLGHGGSVNGRTCLSTALLAQKDPSGGYIMPPGCQLSDYKTDQTGRLVVGTVSEGNRGSKTVWGVSSDFMDAYGDTFRPGAGFLAVGCRTLEQDDMANVLIRKGLGTYVGWTTHIQVPYAADCMYGILGYLAGSGDAIPMSITDSVSSAETVAGWHATVSAHPWQCPMGTDTSSGQCPGA